MQAHATFDIDSWDEEPYESAEGAKFHRARITKSFHGDIEGTSSAELLMVHTAEGPAAYTAHEWFTGTVQGRQGSFVSQHGAVSTAQGVAWTVVGGSGTGELAGMQGTAVLTIDPDGGPTSSAWTTSSSETRAQRAGPWPHPGRRSLHRG